MKADAKNLAKFLDAVVEGYKVRAYEDRFLTVENPEFDEHPDRENPNFCLDIQEVREFLKETSKDHLDLQSVMKKVPQVVYTLRVDGRTILISSITSFSVSPDTLMASIMSTEKNAPIIREKDQDFTLWALGKGAMRRFKTGKFDGSGGISPDEYVWKVKGKTFPFQSYLDHTILMLRDLSFEKGLGHNHLIWKNGAVE